MSSLLIYKPEDTETVSCHSGAAFISSGGGKSRLSLLRKEDARGLSRGESSCISGLIHDAGASLESYRGFFWGVDEALDETRSSEVYCKGSLDRRRCSSITLARGSPGTLKPAHSGRGQRGAFKAALAHRRDSTLGRGIAVCVWGLGLHSPAGMTLQIQSEGIFLLYSGSV